MAALYDVLIGPFADFGFMRRALVASLALGLGAGPVGVILMLRRMSLMGDALSHSVLPGAALGYLLAGGLSLPMMGIGGLIAGLGVALLSGWVSRTTQLKEDASFASFYLTSLALGVMIVSLRGSNVDLLHVLFGSILAIDPSALMLIGGVTTVTVLTFALIYRPLVIECFDPGFLRAVGGLGPFYHVIFLVLVVINLVAGFETLGTLMAVGMMMLPAATAALWTENLVAMLMLAALDAILSGYIGLDVSFFAGVASGPAIILTAAILYVASLLAGPSGYLRRLYPGPHLSG